MKYCSGCGNNKNISDFYKYKDGLMYKACKTCHYERCSEMARQNGHKHVRDWQKSNWNKVLDASRKYRKSHKDSVLESLYKWRERNRERIYEYTRNYRSIRPEWVKVINGNYRARRKTSGYVTLEEWNDLLKRYENKCAYCGITPACITQDHVIPLFLG